MALLTDSVVGKAADAGLPDSGVVLLLFPAVGSGTAVLIRAAVGILADEVFSLPVLAKVRLVSIVLRLATEILPIVSIDAQFLIVVIGERTPGCFEVKHIEVGIRLHSMQQIYRQLLLGMGECAKQRPILTRVDMIRIALTKLRLVLLWMIKLLHSVMRQLTAIPHGTLVPLGSRGDHGAHAASILAQVPSPILGIVMIVQAPLWIVTAAVPF